MSVSISSRRLIADTGSNRRRCSGIVRALIVRAFASALLAAWPGIIVAQGMGADSVSGIITYGPPTGNALIAPGAEPVKIADIGKPTPRSKTEGPVGDHAGNIYFTDLYYRHIYKWSPVTGLSVFTDNSGGANGLFLDSRDRLVGCMAFNRQIAVIDSTGTAEVLADRFKDKRFNEPNDLYIDQKGGIYFSDPYWNVHDEPRELDGEHVFYITPESREVRLVINNMGKPNGIFANPDETVLYVIDTPDNATYAYDIGPDGSLSNRRLFAPEGYDGLTVDTEGNVYLSGSGDGNTVYIYNPAGKECATISIPERVANLCFGGIDRRTLFIAAGTGLYALRMTIPGL